jgi:predicted ester cyclase
MGEAGQPPDAQSVRQRWIAVLRTFPDFHIEPGPLPHGDDHIFVEVKTSGTQAEDFAGIPSSGRAFDTRVACLYEFEGDELVRERVYMDFADITRQLAPSAT